MPLSNYLPSSRLIQPGVCTSTTRPASPYEGQAIYETDTDRTLIWDGSAWKYTWFATIPAFYAGLGSQTSYSAGSAVVFGSATVNNGSHYNTSNGRFTAPVAGLYWFEARLLTQLDTTNCDVRFYKNGSVLSDYAGFSQVATGAGTQHRQTHIQGVVSLAANDYITVNAVGSTINLYGAATEKHTSFTGYWVGN